MSIKLKSSNSVVFIILIGLFFYKIIFFLIIKNNLLTLSFGTGNDADYYHAYAIGIVEYATSAWPILLKFTNEFFLYSRELVSYFLLLLNLIFIPFLFIKIIDLNFFKQQNIYLYAILICIFYPSLFYYTFDIYRDVFMVFIFLLACFFAKIFILNKKKILYLILSLISCFFLYKMRSYLGLSFFISFFIWKLKFTKIRILLIFLFYIIILSTINYFGGFDCLLDYRSLFIEEKSGSFIPIDFSKKNIFIVSYIASILYQVFGLYIFDMKSFFIFIFESIPFIYMLTYVFLNIKYADKFVVFLLIFFILYGTVWNIGNANLGTAIRLRIFNYFSIYLCYFYILRVRIEKNNMKENITQNDRNVYMSYY